MIKQYNPLVSVVIITYNSAAFICDTLKSVFEQSYSNLEVIISDDASCDNTIELCRSWIANHKEQIDKKYKIIRASYNTGVAGNCNRGLEKATGEWIKVIAGDDILAQTAIRDYIDYVAYNPNVKHLFANAMGFRGEFKESNFTKTYNISSFLFRKDFSASDQYKVISKRFFGSGPTYFINAAILREVGGYDERFQMQEDYPLFIKMIGKGYKMEYMDKITVYKRAVETSLQYDKNKNDIFTKNQVRMILDYKYKYREESLNFIWKLLHYYSLLIQTMIVKLGNNKKNPFCVILKLLYSITDPFVIYARYITYMECKYK